MRKKFSGRRRRSTAAALFTRVLRAQTQQCRRHVHATAVGTILRPIGRPCANIMAPLSCDVRPPQPRRRRRCAAPLHPRSGMRVPPRRTGLVPVPRWPLLSLSFYLPSFRTRALSAGHPPATPPGLARPLPRSRAAHSPVSFHLFSLAVLAAASTARALSRPRVRDSAHSPEGLVTPRCRRWLLLPTARICRASTRCASGAHRWLFPFTLRGS